MRKIVFHRLSTVFRMGGFVLLAGMGGNVGGMGLFLLGATFLCFILAVVSDVTGQPDSSWGPRALS